MKRGVKVVLLLVLGGTVVLSLAPGLAERRMNRVSGRSIEVSDHARKIHASLFVADLHADTTLWNRNVLVRGSRGHVDVPRLIEGGLALQAFTIVTKTPRNMNIERNTAKSDNITLLAVAQLWPPRTWNNLTERALYQASRITEAAAHSEGRLSVIRTAADLDAFVARRSQDRKVVAAFIGVEGAHALSGSLANLDRLFDAGVRMMAPTHFFDTEIGGSAHGESAGGLTPL